MKKQILTLAVLSSMSLSAFAQSLSPQSNSDIEVKAVVDAGCDLTADNINFGVLMMPLYDSIAQSNINIKCSKSANVQVEILFQGSAGNSNSQYTFSLTNGGRYASITKNGQSISNSSSGYDIVCTNNSSSEQIVRFYNQQAKDLFGIKSTSSDQIDIWGVCANAKYFDNTALQNLLNSFGTISDGILSGINSGEKIKYFLSHPTKSGEKWSSASQGYNLVTTGENQSISMNANIKRADNATHRLTPDTYQSTLTVVLNY